MYICIIVALHALLFFSPAEKVPSKLPDPVRIPLINLPPTEAQDDPGSATGSTHEVTADSRPAERGVDSVTERSSDARKDSPTKRWIECTCTVMHIHDFVQLLTCIYMYMYTKDSAWIHEYTLSIPCPCNNCHRVPLLPRQPPVEPIEDKGGKKKGGGGGVTSPQPPVEDLSNLELDQQLVVHAYNTAVGTVFHMMTGELKALDVAIWESSKPPASKPPVEQEKAHEGGKEEKSTKGKKDKVSWTYSYSPTCTYMYMHVRVHVYTGILYRYA